MSDPLRVPTAAQARVLKLAEHRRVVFGAGKDIRMIRRLIYHGWAWSQGFGWGLTPAGRLALERYREKGSER